MDNGSRRHLFTVSELTHQVRDFLEDRFPLVWITGEVSNFRAPASNHFYFTLKDDDAQISSVIFRGQNRHLKFTLEDGMCVTGLGRISVYEPRGTYQLIFEYLEPAGVGELQVAFEQLKSRLALEGLFEKTHKKPIPFLPHKISVITSSTGAVIHDILKVARRRFPNVPIQLVPVRVQGYGAEDEIISAIHLVNQRKDADVIILARGGGSLEDFQPFNSESVARALFRSEIPVVCGVGHEVDFTIADFVADLRAPTPSAAAEMVLPDRSDLIRRHSGLSRALTHGMLRCFDQRRNDLTETSRRLVHPRRRLENYRLRIDDLTSRLSRRITDDIIDRERERLSWRFEKLRMHTPISRVRYFRESFGKCREKMLFHFQLACKQRRSLLKEHTARLNGLSPEAVLARGYSITFTAPDGEIVRDSGAVTRGDRLEVRVAAGRIQCIVEGTRDHDIE